VRDAFEIAVAALLGLGGLRSIFVWARRRLSTVSVRDHLLFALFVTGRAGAWFALAALFLGYAVLDKPEDFNWFAIVPIVLAAVSVMCSYALGRSGS
jgi:hypothetical protein